MLTALRNALLRMTRVLPIVGFGGPTEPPTAEVHEGALEEELPEAHRPHDRHVNAMDQQHREGGHPRR